MFGKSRKNQYGIIYSDKNKESNQGKNYQHNGHKDSRRSVTDIRKFFFFGAVVLIAFVTINSKASGHETLVNIFKTTSSLTKTAIDNTSKNSKSLPTAKPTSSPKVTKSSEATILADLSMAAKLAKVARELTKTSSKATPKAVTKPTSKTTILESINVLDVPQQMKTLTANYTSFGTIPGMITITEGSNRIVFTSMLDAMGDNTISPNAPFWDPLGPGKTRTFISYSASFKVVEGSFGAGSRRSWCLILQQGKRYVKVSNLASKTPESLIRPTCVEGK